MPDTSPSGQEGTVDPFDEVDRLAREVTGQVMHKVMALLACMFALGTFSQMVVWEIVSDVPDGVFWVTVGLLILTGVTAVRAGKRA